MSDPLKLNFWVYSATAIVQVAVVIAIFIRKLCGVWFFRTPSLPAPPPVELSARLVPVESQPPPVAAHFAVSLGGFGKRSKPLGAHLKA
jgi:hypothetical protein